MRARFEVRGTAEPQTLLRLLNLFAQLGLVPERVVATLRQDVLCVRIFQSGIDHERATIIAEKMRAMIVVAAVALSWCGAALKTRSEGA